MEANIDQKHPFVSVIVIVYNMEKTIRKCLESLFRQDYPRERFEIIVVDGGSTDGTQDIIRAYEVKFLIEKKRVRGYARNLGVKQAKGDIVAFVDADCSADRRWLVTHVKNHRDNQVGAVGGSIEPLFDGASNFQVEFSRPIVAMEEGEYLPSAPRRYVSYIPTSNASFKREIFSRVGFFDEKLHVAEDTELCLKILKNNYKIIFDPRAQVMHHYGCHFRELNMAQNCTAGMRVRLLMNRYFNGGRAHHRLQLRQKRSSYRLPMSPLLIFILFPGIVGVRILRNLHKMRYVNPKMRMINFVPYVLLASISWIFGYFFESARW